MTPEARALWEQMPEDARERVRKAAPFTGVDSPVILWGAMRRFEQALDEGKPWAMRLERGKAGPSPEEQDELDRTLIARCLAGDYGPEARAAVEDVSRENQHADPRAVLRETRRAVEATRPR